MDVGFVGLGNMGFPMASRLLDAGHRVLACDTRPEAVDRLVALGAERAESPRAVADGVETVMASLPSLQASLAVATGADGVIAGARVKRFVDLSTIGSEMARRIGARLGECGIAAVDSPVSGGVGGAEKGTLAIMVSGPRADVDEVQPLLEAIGRPIYLGDASGAAQTMKLINNLLAATTMVATSEAMVLGVKAGLDANVMIDVLNAGSGATSASRDKFPRAVLPRTFDYGFATGLMAKDLTLWSEEVRALGLDMGVAAAVCRYWEVLVEQEGADSDFTTVVKPIEAAAGVIVAGAPPAR